MNDIKIITSGLELSPQLLQNLIGAIPERQRKERRIPGKWSIHEHACHLVDAQRMIHSRFESFRQHPSPIFEVYLPGKTFSDDYLMNLDLGLLLEEFPILRQRLLDLVAAFEPDMWERQGSHAEYKQYTPHILLRHTLMHDHFHMYRIEELWITQSNFLRAG